MKELPRSRANLRQRIRKNKGHLPIDIRIMPFDFQDIFTPKSFAFSWNTSFLEVV